MRPVARTRTLPAATTGAICASQTTAGAGNLLINGTLASGGVATLTTQSQIGLTSAGNDSGVTFTITGTDANNATVTETLTGPSGATVTSVNSYLTITQIAANAAVTVAMTVDTVQAGADIPVIVDIYLNPGNITAGVEVTGTVNYSVQWCLDDPFNTVPASITWFAAASNLTAASTTQAGTIISPVRAVRLVTNSGGGTAKMIVTQSGAVA